MTSITKPLGFIALLLLTALAGCEQKTPASETTATAASESAQPKRMHPSWDKDGDGINDCENDGSCDHTVDYTQPRQEVIE